MPPPIRLVQSTASILLGVITGVLINLSTDGRGLPYIAGLIVATLAWVWTNAIGLKRSRTRTTVAQRARGSTISGTNIRAGESSSVEMVARGNSVIDNSNIATKDASVQQKATSAGEIRDSIITAGLEPVRSEDPPGPPANPRTRDQ